jgi:hypothetical protein
MKKEIRTMEDMVLVLESILEELQEINGKLDDIKGFSGNCSISDVCDKLDNLETTITLGDNY